MKVYFNEQPFEIYETIVYPAPYLRHEVGRFVNFRLLEKRKTDIMTQILNRQILLHCFLVFAVTGNVFLRA